MEVNIFITKNYDIYNSERVPIIMNLLGHEGLHFVQTLTDDDHDICKGSAGLFSILNVKVKPLTQKTILLLQCCKLCRDENERVDGPFKN